MRYVFLSFLIGAGTACSKFEAKPLLTDEAIVPAATTFEFEGADLEVPTENEMMSDDGVKKKGRFVKVKKIVSSDELDAESIADLQKDLDTGKFFVLLDDIKDLIPQNAKGRVQIKTQKTILLYEDVGQSAEAPLPEPEATPREEKPKPGPAPEVDPVPVRRADPALASEVEYFSKLGVPKDAATKAFEFFKTSPPQIKNRNNIVIADFTAPAYKKRLYLLDLPAKKIDRYYVSHGSGKGKKKNPVEFCKFFGNEENSLLTPPGFLVTSHTFTPRETKQASWGPIAMLLEGLESRNSNTRRREVVMHGSKYTTDDWVQKNGATGQSSGCPSVPKSVAPLIIDKVKGGTLWYHYVG